MRDRHRRSPSYTIEEEPSDYYDDRDQPRRRLEYDRHCRDESPPKILPGEYRARGSGERVVLPGEDGAREEGAREVRCIDDREWVDDEDLIDYREEKARERYPHEERGGRRERGDRDRDREREYEHTGRRKSKKEKKKKGDNVGFGDFAE